MHSTKMNARPLLRLTQKLLILCDSWRRVLHSHKRWHIRYDGDARVSLPIRCSILIASNITAARINGKFSFALHECGNTIFRLFISVCCAVRFGISKQWNIKRNQYYMRNAYKMLAAGWCFMKNEIIWFHSFDPFDRVLCSRRKIRTLMLSLRILHFTAMTSLRGCYAGETAKP